MADGWSVKKGEWKRRELGRWFLFGLQRYLFTEGKNRTFYRFMEIRLCLSVYTFLFWKDSFGCFLSMHINIYDFYLMIFERGYRDACWRWGWVHDNNRLHSLPYQSSPCSRHAVAIVVLALSRRLFQRLTFDSFLRYLGRWSIPYLFWTSPIPLPPASGLYFLTLGQVQLLLYTFLPILQPVFHDY